MNCPIKFLRIAGMTTVLLIGNSFVLMPTMAATIQYNFSGTVDFIGKNLNPNGAFHQSPPSDSNSTMTGTLTVDTSGSHSALKGGGSVGTYTIQTFVLHVGSYEAKFNHADGQTVTIRDGTGNGAGADRFQISAGIDGDSLGKNGSPRVFTIDLGGASDIFTRDVLPNPAPSVSSFVTKVFRLQFGNGNGDGRAVIGSLNLLTAVPLPAAVILFGVGLVALIGLGAGSLRNMRSPEA